MNQKSAPKVAANGCRRALIFLVCLLATPMLLIGGVLLWWEIEYRLESYVPPGTREYMRKQCRRYGGIHGARPIHAKGFLITWKDFPGGRDPNDYRYFTDLGMEYMEYSLNAIDEYEYWDSDEGRQKVEKIESPYIRVTLSDRGDPKCRVWDSRHPDEPSVRESLRKFGLNPDRCLAITKIWNQKDLWSKIKYRLRWLPDKGGPVPFEWSLVEYVDRDTGKVLAYKKIFNACITKKIIFPGEGLVDCLGHSKTSPTIIQCPADQKKIGAWQRTIRWETITNSH